MIRKNYSDEFKLEVVRAYLDGVHGVRMVATTYGLPSKNYIERWMADLIERGLLDKAEIKKKAKSGQGKREAGYNAYRAGKKSEREKQLEKENLRLQAEVAFLKKLRELRGVDSSKQ